MSEPMRSTVSTLSRSQSFHKSSRSAALTRVNTTRARSSAARSMIFSTSDSSRTWEYRRTLHGTSLNWSSAARTTRSAVSPVASLMTTTVFIGGPSLTQDRQVPTMGHHLGAFGIGGGQRAAHVGGDDAAAAAAKVVVAARAARLAGGAPVAKRRERAFALPVRGDGVDARALRRRRREAARGHRARRLGADEKVAAGAAVDRELGEEL